MRHANATHGTPTMADETLSCYTVRCNDETGTWDLFETDLGPDGGLVEEFCTKSLALRKMAEMASDHAVQALEEKVLTGLSRCRKVETLRAILALLEG
jgi:hypothetical protein